MTRDCAYAVPARVRCAGPAGRRSFRSVLAAAAAALALSATGCASLDPASRLQPGMDEPTVREAMGKPDAVVPLPEGGTVWQYPKGPYGQVTWMATFGPDGRLRGVDQALTVATFAKVVPGLSKAEVSRLLGRPYEKIVFRNLGQEIWDWRYKEDGIWDMRFNVHFDLETELVATTTRSMEQRASPGDLGIGRFR